MNKSKAFLKITVVSLAAGMIFGILGYVIMSSQNSIESAIDLGQRFVVDSGWVFLLVCCICFVLAEAVTYGQIRRSARCADQAEGDDIDQWECRLGLLYERAKFLNSMFIAIFFFVTAISLPVHSVERPSWKVMLIMGCIVVSAMFSTIYEIVLIGHIQKRDPSKKGNPADFNFQQVWLESCDEGEKLQAYKAGYHTFTKMHIVYVILWVLALVYRVYFKSGGGAVTMVGFLWVLQSGLYWYQSAKLRKSKLE